MMLKPGFSKCPTCAKACMFVQGWNVRAACDMCRATEAYLPEEDNMTVHVPENEEHTEPDAREAARLRTVELAYAKIEAVVKNLDEIIDGTVFKLGSREQAMMINYCTERGGADLTATLILRRRLNSPRPISTSGPDNHPYQHARLSDDEKMVVAQAAAATFLGTYTEIPEYLRSVFVAAMLAIRDYEKLRQAKQSNSYGQILGRLQSLHDAKGQDYSPGSDPYANMRSSEEIGIPAHMGVFIRLTDKYRRIKSLLKSKKVPAVVNESIGDTLLDLANYSIFCLMFWEEYEKAHSDPTANSSSNASGGGVDHSVSTGELFDRG